MFYKKYQLFNNGVGIMIPTNLKPVNKEEADTASAKKGVRISETILAQYTWLSNDSKVVANVTRGGNNLTEEELVMRLQDYYTGFMKDVSEFTCLNITKRKINDHWYGVMQYTSVTMGYLFYNIFTLGIYEGRELIVTQQCLEKDSEKYKQTFYNIIDSLSIGGYND